MNSLSLSVVHKTRVRPLLLARTQMMAACSRLIFGTWRHEDAELCLSAHETLRRLGDLGTNPFQRMTYAHILVLRGNYAEALEIFERGISRLDRSINLIAHFIANSGKTLTLLRKGHFGEVLRITRAGKVFAEENLARSWLLSLREAWLRTLVFDFKGALKICETIDEPAVEDSDGQPAATGRAKAAGTRFFLVRHFRPLLAPV